MKKNKIIILRFILFFITLASSLVFFTIYAVIKLNQEEFIKSTNLTESQSDDLKDLIGLSNFSSFTIKGYNHKLVTGNDGRHYTFYTTISIDEFENFSEFISNQTNQPDYQNAPHIYIKEDSLTLRKTQYKLQLQIEYNSLSEDALIEYILSNDYIRYSKNTWIIVLQFILLLFVNSLIILPDKIFNTLFIIIKKCPPNN